MFDHSFLRRAALVMAAASLVAEVAHIASADSSTSVTLAGRVIGPDAKPISGAGVLIAAVAPREGEPLLSRYSHSDCLKHTFTDADGRFTIADLAGNVSFTVVVAAAGLKRALIEDVIPEKRPVEVTLVPSKLKFVRSTANDVRGQVLLPDGSPAAGAIVVPRGYRQGDTGLEGPMDNVAESTVADRDGRFSISSTKYLSAMHLEVAARRTVRQFFMNVPTGVSDQELQLVKGVGVRGRVILDGEPAAGIDVGAIWTKHHSGCWFGPWDTTTDEEGRFMLATLTPDEDLCVFGYMKSLGDQGVLTAVPLRGGDGDEIDLGDLHAKPGFGLCGWLKLKGGAALPEHTRVCITRAMTRDQIEMPARADGYFEFKCLPPELVNLYVWQRPPGARYPDYKIRITKDNLSWNPTRASQLHGLITSNREIKIALEDEAPKAPGWTSHETKQWQAIVEELAQSPLRGLPEDESP